MLGKKKGMSETIRNILIALALLAVVVIAISVIKGTGISIIDSVKNLFRR